MAEADIQDGAPRDLLYQTNAAGEITQRDTVTDNADDDGKINITGPHARYYYFGGVEMGDVSNDGTSDVNYAAAIADHRLKNQGGRRIGVRVELMRGPC